MPFYKDIVADSPEGKRTLSKLLELRKALDKSVPEKQMESNLLLATWNIREFGVPKYGGRSIESLYYIAEIINRFDLVAIQEVRKDLATFNKLMSILGSHYEYMFTDVTEGKAGNDERLCFVFDTRKVKFGGLSGELVLPPMESHDPTTKQVTVAPMRQLARTPYMCGFKAGWTNFILTTVHILYGKGVAEDPNRLEEIRQLAAAIRKKSDDEFEWSHNFVLLGDFNIYSRKDNTMKAITSEGFVVPEAIQQLSGSNVEKNKFYDQIAFRVRSGHFETTGKAGIFDFYETVYRNEEEKIYAREMGEEYAKNKTKSTYYKTFWRTFKMSDHLPMWVEIDIDHTDRYLSNRLAPPQEPDSQAAEAPSVEVTVPPKRKKKAKRKNR